MAKRAAALSSGEYERRIAENDALIDRALASGRYEITATGEVFSLKRGRRRLCQYESFGYRKVVLFVDGLRAMVAVHRMLAIAYLGMPKSPLMQVNHKDGNKAGNRVDNIEWTTAAGNTTHAISNGLRANVGESCNLSRLTESDVTHVLRLKHEGFTNRGIAGKLGVTESCIDKIVRGDSWAHVAPDIPRLKKHGNALAGQNNARARLTLDAVREIRSAAPESMAERRKLAKRYGVSVSSICAVIAGRTWKGVA